MVEQRTENPRVLSSILSLGTIGLVNYPEHGEKGELVIAWICGSSSAVERFLAKEEVASSNLVFRSCRSGGSGRRDSLKNCWRAISVSVRVRPSAPQAIEAETGTGYAELCSGSTEDFESSSPGSNPGSAASNHPHRSPLIQ